MLTRDVPIVSNNKMSNSNDNYQQVIDGSGDDISWSTTSTLHNIGMLIVTVFICLLMFSTPCQAQISPRGHRVILSEASTACGSIDIRNNISRFHNLNNCEVIEGNLQILLIQGNQSSEEINNLTFPRLKEITGHLLLFHVDKLRSLGTLFPNLAVIRGNTLFRDYAFVIYQMTHLQEIGLHSLTDIMRGSVRFEKNPLLCFADTIDWNIIAHDGANRHFIGDNKEQRECQKCPNNTNSDNCRRLTSGEPLCWNQRYCQKRCSDSCKGRSCMNNGECCHESCLGGCTGKTSRDCLVCRNVTLNKDCVQNCVANTYKFLNRRCITEKECINQSRPLDDETITAEHPYKTWNDVCDLKCPPGYYEVPFKKDNSTYHKCVSCNGPCKIECPGLNVDTIQSAHKLKGCTHITGSLQVQIKGENVVKELEESLSSIVEIRGFLKIVRSIPLVSLNFLKNLRLIGGQELENNRSALIVVDNPSLQELWDWDSRGTTFNISQGRLFFHFNPKLCYYKVEKLNEIVKLGDIGELEVSKNTNGDAVACNVTRLKANVSKIQSDAAILMWEAFKLTDHRSLLGYVVYSIQAPHDGNVTLYDGRDACGGHGWEVDDVRSADESSPTVYHLLAHLKPYTRYAFFVRTYTISSERIGAQSEIKYFVTKAYTPSEPVNVMAYSNSSTEIVVKWEPPRNPNGNITHYFVTGSLEVDNSNSERNFCKEPHIQLPETKKGDDSQVIDGDKCVCKATTSTTTHYRKPGEVSIKDSEDERIDQVTFEDAIQNHVYKKRSSPPKSKRDIHQSPYSNGVEVITEDSVVDGAYFKFVRNETATKLVIKKLHHYARYSITVQACRAPEGNDTNDLCSKQKMVYMRTLVKKDADHVKFVEIANDAVNNSMGEVRVKWKEPEKPNGVIVTYTIQYTRTDLKNAASVKECITRQDFLAYKEEYTIRNLAPGEYKVQIKATSLAGDGPLSEPAKFYIIEGSGSSTTEILLAVIITCFLLLLSLGGFFYWRKKINPGLPSIRLIANVNPEYVSAAAVYIPDEWEVPRKSIELIRELGQGSFGMVYEGIARCIVDGQSEVACAIKTVNEAATDRERIEFLNEASVMKAFNTHHVVKLLGVVSEGQPTLVVMELMANGDLKTYLRSHRPDHCDGFSKQPPTLKRIHQMALEIADGMSYLSAKKFVHRDLAARNCMVAEDLTVKIGDFGMTRDIYETDYYRKGTKGLLPVRWMAPESLKDGVFTSNSDVWSYGVVLWEMATLASQPYQGLSNDQVLRYVIEGGVMERPENCPDKLYELMTMCWQHKPTHRPHFIELVAKLLPDAPSDFSKDSFYHSPDGHELRAHLADQKASIQDNDLNIDTSETPLRIARDIEDFSVGSDNDEMDEEDEEAELDVDHNPTTNTGVSGVSGVNSYLTTLVRPDNLATTSLIINNDDSELRRTKGCNVSSSESSRGSKISNGSVTTPTQINGYISRSLNGTTTTNHC